MQFVIVNAWCVQFRIYNTFIFLCQVNNTSANPQATGGGLSEINRIKQQLQEAKLPANLREKAQDQIERIALTLKYGGNLSQLDMTEKYIDWIANLPWENESQDTLDIAKAKQILDTHHYGLEKVKERILEYLSVLTLEKQNLQADSFHAPTLFFVGLAGTGKTTFAKSIAAAMNRKLVRIPFGGLASATDLRGQAKVSPEAEPGIIIRSLREVGVRNPVILLDEMDRVSPEARAAVMGALLEILDPGQNSHFVDYFIDYPFDLSHAIFVATGNNTTNVATAVLDRMEVIQMPSYTDQDKINIGKTYVLPKYMQEVGLKPEQIAIDDDLWADIVRPLGFEPGIRSLERIIENMVRKVAFKIVSGEGTSFIINRTNVKEFVK